VPEARPGEAIAGSTLLVCTANICRSPMAEALWRVAAARLRRILPVFSAGLDALPGRPADPACVELLAERGIDLAEHRATRFTPADATRHELVLVMEQEHAWRIMAAAPMLAGRVHLLGRWAAGPIEDPYGAGRSEYEDCLARLDQSIIAWLNRIVIRQDAIRTG
jgi:protein-tyrosine phosphatase